MKVMVKEIKTNKVIGNKVFTKVFVVLSEDKEQISPVEFISKAEAEAFAQAHGEVIPFSEPTEYKIVKVGRSGRKTHLAYSNIGGNNRKFWNVGCSGATSHSKPRGYMDTHQRVEFENITCKDCQQRYIESLGKVYVNATTK